MGLVDLLVVLNHLPYDSQLSYIPNGHVADIKYFEMCNILNIKYPSVLLHVQPYTEWPHNDLKH